jgi:hypothetical protein
MLTFSNDDLRTTLKDRQGIEAAHLDFQPFGNCSERVSASARRIRESGLLPEDFAVHTYVYNVSSGRLDPVEA